MKIKIPPINIVAKDKGKTIWRIVESHYVRRTAGEPATHRSMLRLHWGKLPTAELRILKTKYNNAARAGNAKQIAKFWIKINQLKDWLIQVRMERREDKEPKKRRNQEAHEPPNPVGVIISTARKVEIWFEKLEKGTAPETLYATYKEETLEIIKMALLPLGERLAIIERLLSVKK